MSKRIRLLPGMKFMSGGVLYRPGDILPDTEETRAMVKRKEAEYLDDDEPEEQSRNNADMASPDPDSYEAKNVKTLAVLLKEREIDIPKGAKKEELIALLKADDEAGGNEGAV